MTGGEEILDPAAFARLREWGGDDLLGKIVALFLENAGERLAEVEEGFSEGDLDRVERGAHSLKSSSANVGGVALQQVSARLEAAAEGRDEDEVAAILPEFRARFEDTLKALRETGVAATTEPEGEGE